MAESNFVDYVKILCRSGKGGAGAMHMCLRVVLTAVTAVGEEMFIYEPTVICGLCCI